MTTYVALLRAVNVGGTGKLAMSELRSLCEDAGFAQVATYIASGNVVFDSKATATTVQAKLERLLKKHTGKSIGVMLRTAKEMAAILKANPFPKAAPNFAYVLFLDDRPAKDAVDRVTGLKDEQLRLGKREIYIHYAGGMGKSKMKIAEATSGTARNMNTVAALVDMAKR